MTLMSSSSNLSEYAKALCPSTYCTKVVSPASDLISEPSFTSLNDTVTYNIYCQ